MWQSVLYHWGDTVSQAPLQASVSLDLEDLARSLLKKRHNLIREDLSMYDRRFFASKVGLSALVSIAAMVTFNVYAFTQQAGLAAPMMTAAAAAPVELA